MKALDLFSGIGGFALGLGWAGIETAAFCEIDPFCQKVLALRFPGVPLAADIARLSYHDGVLFDGETKIYSGPIRLISGGFPCQPYSVAGKRGGSADDRDQWPEMVRIISEVRPDFVIGENVPNFAKMGLASAALDLENLGYKVGVFDLPACSVGAPHIRSRLFIVAASPSNSGGLRFRRGDKRFGGGMEGRESQTNEQEGRGVRGQIGASTGGTSANAKSVKDRRLREPRILSNSVSNPSPKPTSERGKGAKPGQVSRIPGFSAFESCRSPSDFFDRPDIPKPLIRRSDDGFSSRVDRLRSIGNAVVPQLVKIIGDAIMEIDREARGANE